MPPEDYCLLRYCGERGDYFLHLPADQCVGCKAPQDHHEFVGTQRTFPDDEATTNWIVTFSVETTLTGHESDEEIRRALAENVRDYIEADDAAGFNLSYERAD